MLSAALLVVAFALATAGRPDASLGEMLSRISLTLPTTMRSFVSTWIADRVLLPLFIRPAWLLPLCFALVCGGWALSLPDGDRPIGRSRLR